MIFKKILAFSLFLAHLAGFAQTALPAQTQYGICLQTCLPMRKIADQKSEQVTQLIFGDAFKVLQSAEDWSEIETTYDQYKGWIPTREFMPIQASTFEKYIEGKWAVAVGKGNTVAFDGQTIEVPAGATLPFLKKNSIKIEDKKMLFQGKSNTITKFDVTGFLATAQSYLGVPYLWGGKSPVGWDCSGFVQMVGKMNGLKLLRDSYQQAEQGEKIAFKDAQAGDIAFFQRKSLAEGETKVIHVGIYIGKGQIVHADGVVRINTLDSTGIYRDDLQKHSHYLKFLRRHK